MIFLFFIDFLPNMVMSRATWTDFPLNFSKTCQICAATAFRKKLWRPKNLVGRICPPCRIGLKISLQSPIVQKCIKCWSRIVHRIMVNRWVLTELLPLKVPKKCRHKHFSWTLRCNNSVRMHRIIIVLWPFLTSIQCAVRLCKLIFNWVSLIFTWFKVH